MHSDKIRINQIIEQIKMDPAETHTFSCSEDAYQDIASSVGAMGLKSSQIGLGSDSQVLIQVHP